MGTQKSHWGFLFGIMLAYPALGFDQSQVGESLEKAHQAMSSLNYEGTFVYLNGSQMESMRIFHRVDEQGEHERLISLNGAAREIIRDNEEVRCILPDSQAVLVDKSRPQRPFANLLTNDFKSLQNNYRLRFRGVDRIAGRDANVIEIIPRDQYRFGFRMFVDKETFMPLKSDLVGLRGVSIEQVMFTDLQIVDQVSTDKILPTISGDGYTLFKHNNSKGQDSEAKSIPDSKWEGLEAPKGFVFDTHKMDFLPDSNQPVEHIVFSDGLVSISVYIENKSSDRRFLDGLSQLGAVSAYGSLVGESHVTVVGEVPEVTVRFVSDRVAQFLLQEKR